MTTRAEKLVALQTEYKHVWLDFCKSCDVKHYVANQPCPTCGIYVTPQPVFRKVAERCSRNYQCDSCLAYEEHLR